jgi:hypothetical protein
MTTVGWPLDAVSGAPSYTGRALRTASLAPLLAGATATRPLGARSGVRPGTPSTTVTVAGSTWAVAPHAGVLDVEAAAQAGPYGYAVVAAESGSIVAADATYARWDLISVQLSDPAEGDGTTTPGVSIVYTAGTPAAAPAQPATPSRAMPLARIVVPKSGGGAASVVWLATHCGLADGVSWFETEAARDVAIPAAQRRAGMKAVIGSGAAMAEYTWNGSGWKLVAEDTGWVTTGLTLTPGTNWAVTSYRLRRINGRVTGTIVLTYSGSSIATNTGGAAAAEQTMVTLPAGWNAAGYTAQPDLARLRRADAGGVSQIWWARGFSTGAYNITAGPPSASLPSGGVLWLYVDHPVD